MASQPTRPRFRLPSVARPVPAPAPAPAPAPTLAPGPPPPQPRPPLIRPTFRPITQPQPPPPPPPEPTAAPPPPPPVTTLPPPPPATTTPPSPRPANINDAVPASPQKQIVAFPTASVPSSPQKPTPPSPPIQPIPKPTSPIQNFASPKQASTATEPIPTTASRVATPPLQARELSPRIIKPVVQTPHQSPYNAKPIPAAPPPSPLVLPPPQIIKLEGSETDQARIPPEAEQKTVLVQKTFSDHNKPNKPWQNGSDSEKPFPETSKPGFTEDHHMKKDSSDSEEGGMRVITVAGENRGAFMEVIRSPLKVKPDNLYKKENPSNHEEGRGWKSYTSSSSSSGEEKANKSSLGKADKGRGIESPLTRAFVNSNVQGVNNSILCNSSCNHQDPGVHLSFSRKPAVGGTSRAGFHHLGKEEPGNTGYQS